MDGTPNQRSVAPAHRLSSSQRLDARNGRRMAFRAGRRGDAHHDRASLAVPLSDRVGVARRTRRRRFLHRRRRAQNLGTDEVPLRTCGVNGNGRYHHRVAVTGIGVITPIGIGIDDFWKATIAEKVGTRSITRFDPSEFNSHVAAEVADFDPADYLDNPKRLRRTDRFAQFSVAAARLALRDADYRIEDGNEAGVWIGSALGGLAFAEEQHDRYRLQGLRAVKPLLAIAVFGGSATTNVALEFGIRGPNVANSNSCAAGTVAIGDAFRAIARGEVRMALAGGVEAPLSPLIFGAFALINSMSRRNHDPSRASRPFDADRDGFVMAEGAGIFVLERYEDALARDARIYGEILGFGLTGDAHHMTAPLPDGSSAARAVAAALAEARVTADEVELFDAHGSSSPLNDRTETIAFKRVFR